jgi:hypothetical protein
MTALPSRQPAAKARSKTLSTRRNSAPPLIPNEIQPQEKAAEGEHDDPSIATIIESLPKHDGDVIMRHPAQR